MKTYNKFTIPFLFLAVLLLASCSSEDSRMRSSLEFNEREGRYNSVYSDSKEVVENSEFYNERTVKLAERLRAESFKKLKRHHGSIVNSSLISKDIGYALARYEAMDEEFKEELVDDVELQERLARGYIEAGKLSRAKDAMQNVFQYAESSESRTMAEDYIRKVDELAEANETLIGYKETIKSAAEKYGFMVGNDGLPSTHCSYTAQEDVIPQHIQELIDTFNDTASRYGELTSELGKPGRVARNIRS